MISNKEAILADAQAKADTIIARAEVTHSELVSEHQIMQQAYAQANEVVMIATKQAQEILDKATVEANSIRMGSITYTDERLAGLEAILTNAIETTKARYENLMGALSDSLQIVLANRAELMPQTELAEEPPAESRSSQANQRQGQ